MENSHLQWATDRLKKDGYQLNSLTPDVIQKTEWSTVYRLQTNRGAFFLKKVPPALYIEPKIIDILSKEFHAAVPYIISTNEKEHCFLMEDAGIQMHQFFKENFNADVFIRTMQDYIALQMKATNKIDLFINIGVPDWRLEKFPALYQELVSNEALLIGDGLSKDELKTLKKMSSKLLNLCEKLSVYKIKDTFGHADFHDKNILIKPQTNQTTMIDLGEVVITHPFFSFKNCLHMARENFSLADSQYNDLLFKCLQPWLELETKENLLDILDIIQQCWSIHAVLGEWRLINSVEPINSQKMRKQKRLSKKLRYWIGQS